MYQHSVMHLFSIISMSLVLTMSVLAMIVGRRRGQTEIVRRCVPIVASLVLNLVSQTLRGGPHDDAGTLLGMAADVVFIVSSVRLVLWQRRSRPVV